jgi:hypothetical protein
MFGKGKRKLEELEQKNKNLAESNLRLKAERLTERESSQRAVRIAQKDYEAQARALEEAWPLRQREQVKKLVSLVDARLRSPGDVRHLPSEQADPLLRKVLKELEDDE